MVVVVVVVVVVVAEEGNSPAVEEISCIKRGDKKFGTTTGGTFPLFPVPNVDPGRGEDKGGDIEAVVVVLVMVVVQGCGMHFSCHVGGVVVELAVKGVEKEKGEVSPVIPCGCSRVHDEEEVVGRGNVTVGTVFREDNVNREELTSKGGTLFGPVVVLVEGGVVEDQDAKEEEVGGHCVPLSSVEGSGARRVWYCACSR